MPIKYIGRTTDFKGKTLWEILGNLKNFGVGRLVMRNQHQRYPEPSYIKILKVAALPSCPVDSVDEQRKVIALVEKTFRGVKFPKPVQIDSASYKTDYILIPKDEEARYTEVPSKEPEFVVQETTDFPPLLREMILHKARLNNTAINEPKMKIRYNKINSRKYRFAKEGETPIIQVCMDLGVPVINSLYPHLKKQSQETTSEGST